MYGLHFTGDYVMVIGEIQQATDVKKIVKSLKITQLSTDTVAQKIWNHEVKDLQKYAF